MPGLFSSLAALSGTIGTAALVGGGATAATAMSQPKKEKLPPMPTAPTPTDAKETARLEGEKLRRIRAMAGGKTILTSEGMGTGSGLKTLLGS